MNRPKLLDDRDVLEISAITARLENTQNVFDSSQDFEAAASMTVTLVAIKY
ncbi:MAG TPA: hypothetical protein VJL54_06805 [Nitrososphaera sp.]|jgi:hypothetical protein|nr:hypothetical protein [Nitrososphaera sp.]